MGTVQYRVHSAVTSGSFSRRKKMFTRGCIRFKYTYHFTIIGSLVPSATTGCRSILDTLYMVLQPRASLEGKRKSPGQYKNGHLIEKMQTSKRKLPSHRKFRLSVAVFWSEGAGDCVTQLYRRQLSRLGRSGYGHRPYICLFSISRDCDVGGKLAYAT